MQLLHTISTSKKIVRRTKWWAALPFLLMFLVSASCGGGGAALLAGGGIGGTGITSVGPILAFGSIWVNGVEYEIDSANITVNGTTTSQAELTRGMIVRVKGTINADGVSGNADSVSYTRDIAGPVSTVDQANRTITVLGQTISWDEETFGDDIESDNWNPPAVGEYVEISGMPTQDGWLARAINHHAPEENDELSGIISNLDTQTRTFTLNSLDIHYMANMDDTLQNGDYIEVKGQLQGNFFNASKIEKRHPDLAGENEEMEVEGVIHGYDANAKMLIIRGSHGQYTIDANGAAFKHGTETDLVQGRRVEAEGYIQNSLFFAEEIEFKGADNEE